jgi:hypothetical protein
MNRRRGVAGRVDLINDEVPFAVVTAVIRERTRLYRDDLRGRGRASLVLPSNEGARRTRAEKYKYETGQREHPSEK